METCLSLIADLSAPKSRVTRGLTDLQHWEVPAALRPTRTGHTCLGERGLPVRHHGHRHLQPRLGLAKGLAASA